MSLEKIEQVLKLLNLKITPAVIYLVNYHDVFVDYQDLKNKYPNVPPEMSAGTLQIKTNDINIEKIFL